jgi:hypothetical protein
MIRERTEMPRFGQGSLLILYIGIKSSQLQSIVEPRWVSSSAMLVVQEVMYIVKQETSNHVATQVGESFSCRNATRCLTVHEAC